MQQNIVRHNGGEINKKEKKLETNKNLEKKYRIKKEKERKNTG